MDESRQLNGTACECRKLDCISKYDAKEFWPIFKAKFNKCYGPCEAQRRFKIFMVEDAAKKANKITVTELADAILPSSKIYGFIKFSNVIKS